MATQRDVNVRIAIANADRALQELRSLGTEGERAFNRITGAQERVARSGQPADRAIRQTRAAIGNLGQQIQDVTIQLQAGTNPFTIIAQQGPQMISAIGPAGAAIGALVAIIAVATGAAYNFATGASEARSASDLFTTAINDNTESLRKNVEELAEVDAAQRRFFANRATEARAALLAGIGREEIPLSAIIAQVEAPQIATPPQPSRATGGLPGFAGVGEELDPTVARARARSQAGLDVTSQLKAAVESGKGASEVFRVVERLGLNTEGRSGAAIEELAKKADEIATLNALIDVGKSGQSPALLPNEGPSFIRELRRSQQSALDTLGSPSEQIAAEERKLGAVLTKLAAARQQEGADLEVIKALEEQAREIAARRIKAIEEGASKEAEAAARRKAADERRAAAAATVAGADQERINLVQIEVEQLQRLDAANRISAEEYRRVQIEIAAENAERQLSIDATPEQIKAIKTETVEREKLRDSIAGTSKARQQEAAEAQREQQKREAELERLADEQARLLFAPFGTALRNIQNQATDFLTEFYQGNVKTFKDAASAAKGIFARLFAELTTLAIIRPQLVFGSGGLLAGLGGSSAAAATPAQQQQAASAAQFAGPNLFGVGGTLGSAFPSVFGSTPVTSGGIIVGQTPNSFLSGLGGVSTGGLLASGGLGALGGGLLAGLAGGNPTGGTIGGGLGAALGFGVGGPLGAIVGGLGGSLLGGLFGGEKNLGNNNFGGSFDIRTGGISTGRNTNPDPGNVDIVNKLFGALDALREGLKDTGVAIGDATVSINAGSKTGIRVDGQQFGTADQAAVAAFRKLLDVADLDPRQRQAVSRSEATTPEDLIRDLNLPKLLDELREPSSALTAGIAELRKTFRNAAEDAKRLGLSTEGLSAARKREEANLRLEAKAELGLVTPLQLEMARLQKQFDAARRSAADLGVSIAKLDEQQRKQTETLLSQAQAQITGLQAGFRGRVEGAFAFLDPLRAARAEIASAQGTPITQLAEARARFEETRGLAEGGDLRALAALPDIARQVTAIARETFATGREAIDVERDVLSSLSTVIERGQAAQAEVLKNIDGEIAVLSELVAALNTERREVVLEVKGLRSDVRRLEKKLAA